MIFDLINQTKKNHLAEKFLIRLVEKCDIYNCWRYTFARRKLVHCKSLITNELSYRLRTSFCFYTPATFDLWRPDRYLLYNHGPVTLYEFRKENGFTELTSYHVQIYRNFFNQRLRNINGF